ncbi:MAG: tyrosine-protein phosphatase [Spirochaetes bacterium]|nr:tyrosine-protein phosphatase [Spirochaetota bacterium]
MRHLYSKPKTIYFAALAAALTVFGACHDGFEPEPPSARNGLLPLAGAFNARDLGQSGLVGAGGRAIRPGVIVRSGELSMLTPRDVDFLFGDGGMGIRTVVDLRSTLSPVNHVNTPFTFAMPPAHHNPAAIAFSLGRSERENAPSRLPGHVQVWDRDNARPSTGIRDYEIVIDYFEVIQGTADFPNPAAVVHQMALNYATFIQSDAAAVAFGSFFEALLYANGTPLLFHCSAGKDRAGMASMLLLMALGVDRHSIVHNFMLSREFVQRRFHPVVPFIVQDVQRNMIIQRAGAQQLLILHDETPGGAGEMPARAALAHSVTPGLMAAIIEDRVNNHGESLFTAREYALANMPTPAAVNAAIDETLLNMRWLALRSDQYLANFARDAGEKIRPLLSVYPQWIEFAIDAIRDMHPGGNPTNDEAIEYYLVNHLNLPADIMTQLRRLFLVGYTG